METNLVKVNIPGGMVVVWSENAISVLAICVGVLEAFTGIVVDSTG